MNCCDKNNQKIKRDQNKKESGILTGLIYGLAPHIGCIAFIIFSALGATFTVSVFKPFLLNPYFFHILIGLSFVFATISALFYFKKQGLIILNKKGGGLALNFLLSGIKRKWKYLLTLYGTTVGVNLLLFMVIFPIAANFNLGIPLTASISAAFGRSEALTLPEGSSLATLQVDIPCPGHAPLIIWELRTIDGVEAAQFRFQFPNYLFDVAYNPEKTSKEQILSLDVFSVYQATIVNETMGN